MPKRIVQLDLHNTLIIDNNGLDGKSNFELSQPLIDELKRQKAQYDAAGEETQFVINTKYQINNTLGLLAPIFPVVDALRKEGIEIAHVVTTSSLVAESSVENGGTGMAFGNYYRTYVEPMERAYFLKSGETALPIEAIAGRMAELKAQREAKVKGLQVNIAGEIHDWTYDLELYNGAKPDSNVTNIHVNPYGKPSTTKREDVAAFAALKGMFPQLQETLAADGVTPLDLYGAKWYPTAHVVVNNPDCQYLAFDDGVDEKNSITAMAKQQNVPVGFVHVNYKKQGGNVLISEWTAEIPENVDWNVQLPASTSANTPSQGANSVSVAGKSAKKEKEKTSREKALENTPPKKHGFCVLI